MDYCPNNRLQYENTMHETRMKAQKLLTFGIKYVHGKKNPQAFQRLHLFNIEISSTIFHLDQLLSTMKENPIFLNIFIEINCF